MKTLNHNDSEVLFQKLGDTWYAFTEVNDSFVYSALPDGVNPHKTKIELFEIIEEHMEEVARQYSRPEQVA